MKERLKILILIIIAVLVWGRNGSMLVNTAAQTQSREQLPQLPPDLGIASNIELPQLQRDPFNPIPFNTKPRPSTQTKTNKAKPKIAPKKPVRPPQGKLVLILAQDSQPQALFLDARGVETNLKKGSKLQAWTVTAIHLNHVEIKHDNGQLSRLSLP